MLVYIVLVLVKMLGFLERLSILFNVYLVFLDFCSIMLGSALFLFNSIISVFFFAFILGVVRRLVVW